MRVGIFVSNADKLIGGGATYEQSILKYLLNCQTEHKFYFFSYSEVTNLNLSPNKHFQKIDKDIPEQNLNYFCKKYNIDIIWYINLYYEETNCPYIVTTWDLQHRLQPYFPELIYTGWPWRFRESFYKNSLPGAAYIFAGNEEFKSQITRFYGISDDRIIVNPLFTSDFYFETESSIQINDYGKYIFYPAQFWPHKNHIRLLYAMKKLDNEYKLILTGSDKGNLEYIKTKINELDLQDRVIYKGFVSDSELKQLYKFAHALVFPSYFGPDNIPPLEAMAMKCPVIYSDVPGHKEQLKDCALYFDPNSEDEIVKQVLKLEDQGYRNQLIDKAYKLVSTRTVNNYMSKFFDILDKYKKIRETWGDTYINT